MATVNCWTEPLPRANPSRSMTWSCFNDLRNEPTTLFNMKELVWHAAIDLTWARLSHVEKCSVVNHAHYWGPNAKPKNPREGTEDWLREKFWPAKGRVPRCPTCLNSERRMPGHPSFFRAHPEPAEFPIGIQNCHLLPCGCTEEAAIFEAWAIATGTWTKTCHEAGRTLPAPMGKFDREQMMRAIKRILALDPDSDELDVQYLFDYSMRIEAIRSSARPNAVNQGAPNNNTCPDYYRRR